MSNTESSAILHLIAQAQAGPITAGTYWDDGPTRRMRRHPLTRAILALAAAAVLAAAGLGAVAWRARGHGFTAAAPPSPTPPPPAETTAAPPPAPVEAPWVAVVNVDPPAAQAPAAKRAPAPKPRPAAPAATGPGTLLVTSNPPCRLLVDGKPSGSTPLGELSLPAGRHKVTFVNDEYAIRYTRKVKIVPGETTKLDVDLVATSP